MRERASERLGFRGRVLVLVALVWLLVGLRTTLDPNIEPHARLFVEILPVWFRVALWVGAAGVAILRAWWPPGGDRRGYQALVIPAALRAGSYWWAAILGIVTGNELGSIFAWVGAVAWTAIVAFVLILSGWPEPPRLPPVDDGSRR